MIQSTLINLHPNKYSQEFHYYPFAVKLDRCSKVCIPSKAEDLNLSVLNMITRVNESKTLTKYISCECKSKFDGTVCTLNQWWNKDKCRCEYKKHHVCEEVYVWNHSTCSRENVKYLPSIIDDSTAICDKGKESYNEEIKTIPTNSNEKKVTCKI